MRVAVLAGGRSSEREVSLASAAAVRDGLARAGHEVVAVEIAAGGAWSDGGGEPVALNPGRGLLGADVAFPVLHGPYGEDGTVQGLLEALDVPYVGAGVLASAVCMDKLVFKDLLAHAGMPQVDYERVAHAEWRADRGAVLERAGRLGLPAFVKPANLGSSVGIARVGGDDALGPAIGAALSHDPRVIVEAASEGMEVECSVLGNEDPVASQPGEIVLARKGWYDYAAKYEPGGMELVVPARVPEEVRERARELALAAFALTGCAGMARVDFFVEGEDVLVNELNTIPGFTETSVYAKLWEASGIGYEQLLQRLLACALERHRAGAAYRR